MRWPFSTIMTLCALYASLVSNPAHALNPDRSIAQYKHTSWTMDQGVPRGPGVISQGPNGYLWLSSAQGLYRFDGNSFELIPREDPVTSEGGISTILVTRENDVWVGYTSGATALYHSGVLKGIPMSDSLVMNMVQARDGDVWTMTGAGGIYRFHNSRWHEVGERLGFPKVETAVMTVTRDGTLYVSTVSNGIFFLLPGARRFERATDVSNRAIVSEDGQGNRWISDPFGSRLMRSGRQEIRQQAAISYPTPEAHRNSQTLFDRDGNLWGFTDEGIYRVVRPTSGATQSKAQIKASVSRYRAKDGLTSDLVASIFEDREGNIWVATELGIDRFRNADTVVEPALTNRALWSDILLRASDGSVYVGERSAVYRIKPGGKPEAILPVKETFALCEAPDESIWIVSSDRVVRLRGNQKTVLSSPVVNDDANDCAIDAKGQIWIVTSRQGIIKRVGGTWQRNAVPGAVTSRIMSLLRRSDGKILAINDNLLLLDPPAPPQILVSPKPYYNPLLTVYEAPDRLLFGGDSGLGEVRAGRERLLSPKRFPALRAVSGIVQTLNGQTWASSANGPVMMKTADMDRALADPLAPLPIKTFDVRDGMMSTATYYSTHSVVAGRDGRLWFAIGTGTVWIDPQHLERNSVIPPVRIGRLVSDGKTILDPEQVRLEAGNHTIEIGFAALSLSIPERVRVLYQLVGEDRAWIDPGMRRQAFYNNLGPGHYVFRVIAANNDGVWNRKGASLQFDIPPTFVQSNLCFALCVFGFGLLLWTLYRLRVRQLTGKMRERLEARLAERERIARDLHDTLLQGFQGLILRFQSVANEIPENLRARTLFENTLDSADKVLSAGRENVKHLRAIETKDLATLFVETSATLQRDHRIQFEVVVEGTPQELHPIVYEELYRIGNEALINAFRHSSAGLIELVISYQESLLTMGVRDNGIGIDPEVVERGGRQGHFGLVGMRERAQQIQSDIAVSSRDGGGTEVQITVPGRIAYVTYRHDAGWWQLLWDRLGLGSSTRRGI